MYILLFICAFMGTLACIDLIRSLERVTCDSVTQLNTLGQSFALVGTNVSAYSSQRSADANTQLDQGLDGLACARDALVNLCARVEEQHSAALALDARLDNATDAWDSALGLSAQASFRCYIFHQQYQCRSCTEASVWSPDVLAVAAAAVHPLSARALPKGLPQLPVQQQAQRTSQSPTLSVSRRRSHTQHASMLKWPPLRAICFGGRYGSRRSRPIASWPCLYRRPARDGLDSRLRIL